METLHKGVEVPQTEQAYRRLLDELWELLTAEKPKASELTRMIELLDCVEAYERIHFLEDSKK